MRAIGEKFSIGSGFNCKIGRVLLPRHNGAKMVVGRQWQELRHYRRQPAGGRLDQRCLVGHRSR